MYWLYNAVRFILYFFKDYRVVEIMLIHFNLGNFSDAGVNLFVAFNK